MNVLKQIHFSWRVPFNKNYSPLIQYYVHYERENHIVNRRVHNYIYETHDDAFDAMILNALDEQIKKIPGIYDYYFEPKEFVMWPDFEEERRAILSTLAIGADLRPLRIIGRDGVLITTISARLWFMGINNPALQNHFLPLVPSQIRIEHIGPINSLISCPFMGRDRAAEVLHRDDDIDLSRFQSDN